MSGYCIWSYFVSFMSPYVFSCIFYMYFQFMQTICTYIYGLLFLLKKWKKCPNKMEYAFLCSFFMCLVEHGTLKWRCSFAHSIFFFLYYVLQKKLWPSYLELDIMSSCDHMKDINCCDFNTNMNMTCIIVSYHQENPKRKGVMIPNKHGIFLFRHILKHLCANWLFKVKIL